jgi:hypothetical protein
MRRRLRGDRDHLRAEQIERFRHLCATPAASLDPGSGFPCPWPKTLAKLEAGERVIVSGWQIKGHAAEGLNGTYWLEPDGSLTPAEKLK